MAGPTGMPPQPTTLPNVLQKHLHPEVVGRLSLPLPEMTIVLTATESQHQVQGALLMNTTLQQGMVILQLTASKDQALLLRRDTR